MAPDHVPFFITPPGETDVLMVAMGIFLVAAVLWVGTLYWRLHSLPERMAHKSEKLQFEIVAILGLLALFTHIHLFWVAALLLAMIDIPDFGTPLRSIAGSVEKIADTRSDIGVEADQEARSDMVSLSPHLPEKKSANVAKEARGGHV
jgi:hypothetical protein